MRLLMIVVYIVRFQATQNHLGIEILSYFGDVKKKMKLSLVPSMPLLFLKYSGPGNLKFLRNCVDREVTRMNTGKEFVNIC